MDPKAKVFLISLGCAKNLVDSEHMLGQLKSEGFEFASRIEEADIAVINTCAFIQTGVEEAIDTILEAGNLRRQGKLKRLIVAGCLVQRYGYKLRRDIPEVDGWLGTGEMLRISDVALNGRFVSAQPFFIGRPTVLPDHSAPRIQTTPFYSAYLKVADGCSHGCSYCMIPRLRGPFRSRSMASVITEAKGMVRRGVKEINLVAQDITMYGEDLEESPCLEELLEHLVMIEGLRWVRLMYCNPWRVSDRLLELMDTEPTICPYLDLPLQHVHKALLKEMGRDRGEETPWELIERIRSRGRRISIRTTLMVGFPGETDEMFRELCDFVKMAQFDHLGVFVFSPEKGTRAARLGPRVDSKVAKRRLDDLMRIQRDISKTRHQDLVGHILPVLIEGQSPETEFLLKGRTATMAPEVDGQVLINEGNGILGEIMPVRVREAHAYDLIGEIVEGIH